MCVADKQSCYLYQNCRYLLVILPCFYFGTNDITQTRIVRYQLHSTVTSRTTVVTTSRWCCPHKGEVISGYVTTEPVFVTRANTILLMTKCHRLASQFHSDHSFTQEIHPRRNSPQPRCMTPKITFLKGSLGSLGPVESTSSLSPNL